MKSAPRAIAIAAMIGSLCASWAIAEETSQPNHRDTNSNLRVVIDSQTGQARAPTPEELQALIEAERAARAAESSARSALRSAPATAPDVLPAERTVQRHPNGMVSVRLPQESLSLLKLATDENGNVRLVHAKEATVAPAEEK
jgi:hypothetical protein